jgi:hypothetical protein
VSATQAARLRSGDAVPAVLGWRDALGVVLALVVVSPAAPVAFGAGTWLLRRQARHGWVAVGVAALGAVLAVAGVSWLGWGDPLSAGYGGLVEAARGRGDWLSGLARTMPTGIPAGVLVAAVWEAILQRRVRGSGWHPADKRRQALRFGRAWRAAGRARREAAPVDGMPPLGAYLEGDADRWRAGRYVALPDQRVPAMALLGESGSGKTETALRMVEIMAARGRKVYLLDAKGTDPDLPGRVFAAYRAARPGAVCLHWPEEAVNLWLGGRGDVANRLTLVQDPANEFYKAALETIVRLAVGTGEDPPPVPRNPGEFMARLDTGWLRRTYEHTPQEADVKAAGVEDGRVLSGVRLRYSGFFGAVGPQITGGMGWEHADCGVFTIPTLARPADAEAVVRMLLADFGSYCVSRKPRTGEDVTLIVDEFSAVTSSAPQVIQLAERVRDSGGQIVISAQGFGGLGQSSAERMRTLEAVMSGGLILHRIPFPGQLLEAAGTVLEAASSWWTDEELDDGRSAMTGKGNVQGARRLRVDPDDVRQADTGEAWAVQQGRAVRFLVIPTAQVQAPAGDIDVRQADTGEAWAPQWSPPGPEDQFTLGKPSGNSWGKEPAPRVFPRGEI